MTADANRRQRGRSGHTVEVISNISNMGVREIAWDVVIRRARQSRGAPGLGLESE